MKEGFSKAGVVQEAPQGYCSHSEIKTSSGANLVQIHANESKSAPKRGLRTTKNVTSHSKVDDTKNNNHLTFSFISDRFCTSDNPIYQLQKCTLTPPNNNTQAQNNGDELITQIQQIVSSRREIEAAKDEILITHGIEESLQLVASFVSTPTTIIAVENSGNNKFHSTFKSAGAQILPIDADGLLTGKPLKQCDYLCITPSSRYPSTVNISLDKKQSLIDQASRDQFIIVEEDIESDVNFLDKPLPALKSMDDAGKVIYIGGLTNSLSPDVKIGYLIASPSLIKGMRAIQEKNENKVSIQKQRNVANFISLGYYDNHVQRIRSILERKWIQMIIGLELHLTECKVYATAGSLCTWIKLPDGISSELVVEKAAACHVLIESDNRLFGDGKQQANFIRLGFSAIAEKKIELGLIKLGEIIRELSFESAS